MRILLVIAHYYPDGGPSAPLFTMLSERLARRGHEVTVLASVPHYPTGRVPAAYRGILLRRAFENGVHVIRVWVPSVDRARLIQRFTQFVSFQLSATIAAFRLRPDIILGVTPAFLVWLPYTFLVWVRRKPAIYSVHDVYPDVGVRLGVFRNPIVTWAVSWLERTCLAGAAKVRVLTESFIPAMMGLGVAEEKLCLIHDWVDTDLIRPLPRDNSFSAEQGLDGHFVVLYAGNMGPSHGLTTIVDAAALVLREDANIRFVFVGEGIAKDVTLERANRSGLSNVLFLPYQPHDLLPRILASADVSLVSLGKGFGQDSLPSKTFSILASGRPVIASVDPGSDTWRLVIRSQAGLCVPPEDPRALADAILELSRNSDLCHACGQRGRAYALEHHSPDSAALAFERLFEDAIRLSHKSRG